MADNEFKAPRFCLIRQIQKILRFPYELSLLTNVILREVKRSRRIYWKTIELSFCAEQSEVAESLLYQNITTIPLNRAPELNFQPYFQVFLQTFKNPKTDFSSIHSVTSIIKNVVRSLFPGKIVSTLL